jgi:hypothetical protein
MMIEELQMVNPSCDCLGSLDMKNTSTKGLRGNHYIQNEDPYLCVKFSHMTTMRHHHIGFFTHNSLKHYHPQNYVL